MAPTCWISRDGKMFLANRNATVVADRESWFGLPTDRTQECWWAGIPGRRPGSGVRTCRRIVDLGIAEGSGWE